MYEILYTKKAHDDLKRLDVNIARRILKKMQFFVEQVSPLSFAKKLTDFNLGEYRFRVGDYRIICDVDSKGKITVLLVLSIKHRKNVYNL